MNNIDELYSLWCEKATEDADIANELAEIKNDEAAKKDRFYCDLTFGTGGLRGVIGAGTNRMNIYTVAQATQGLADYLKETFTGASVAVGYDSRINSDIFAKTAAEVLAGNGIKVWFFKELIPTPVVSYAVRYFNCSSGIVITASHNPSKYNGYKCYDPHGYQITDAAADRTLHYIEKVDMFTGVKKADFDKSVANGLIEFIPENMFDSYFAQVASRQINPGIAKQSKLKIIYTPLNGTGNKPVRRILSDIGFDDVTVVRSQEHPDGNFPTCPFPNPEIKQAFEEALKMTKRKPADLLIATDPDCDRMGIAVPVDGEYRLFSGNEVGCILTEYILSCKKKAGTLASCPVIVKTIVTCDLAYAIGKAYGAEVFDLLTGFKYIGELMTQLEEKGEADRFELGFEESYGYLSGIHTRDKDAVNAAMLIAECAAWCKQSGKTLMDYLNEIYAKYGYYKNDLFNYYFEGADGMAKMADMMDALRKNTPTVINSRKVKSISDYLLSEKTVLADGTKEPIFLPKSNVISILFESGDKIIVRPAGTEPKIKVYTSVIADNETQAADRTAEYKADMEKILGIAE